MSRSRPIIGGVVVLYFIIALEVLVMISPFAAFFYSVFNPFLLLLARWPATHWLADFFLPHMVLPPDLFLKGVRVAGSVLFVGGSVAFLVCAGQVYFHKLARRGPALGGLYTWIRHPQYLSLAVTGLGLAVLWPRFLTVVLWTVMVGLYSLLARDEERRMLAAFGDQYRSYMSRTGRFLPRPAEELLGRFPGPSSSSLRAVLGLLLLLAITLGGSFALRALTVHRLPLWSDGRISVLAILPGDAPMLQHRMEDVIKLPEVESRLPKTGAILAYSVPIQYVMQGMIADTGPAYRLYEHHQTVSMILDWIFHPFRHLEGGHMMMHHAGTTAGEPPPSLTARRIIFLQVPTAGEAARADPSSLFAIGAVRVPQFFVDVDFHTLTVLQAQELGPGTGWGSVPTPMF
jgi:protein-S-isoprenylcysteine O-methyltransferase Ste14